MEKTVQSLMGLFILGKFYFLRSQYLNIIHLKYPTGKKKSYWLPIEDQQNSAPTGSKWNDKMATMALSWGWKPQVKQSKASHYRDTPSTGLACTRGRATINLSKSGAQESTREPTNIWSSFKDTWCVKATSFSWKAAVIIFIINCWEYVILHTNTLPFLKDPRPHRAAVDAVKHSPGTITVKAEKGKKIYFHPLSPFIPACTCDNRQ